ncbi:MAG: copper amine oxidase N-terminal domain-containing protein [Defluviitaleaceae bacterium]|nr:copper amine oxidase N-terminal domain-containing protein [Defluviitaleaceae bacterium]
MKTHFLKLLSVLIVLALLAPMTFVNTVAANYDPYAPAISDVATGDVVIRVQEVNSTSARLDVRLNTQGDASPLSASGSINGIWFNRQLNGTRSFTVDIPNLSPGLTINVEVLVEFTSFSRGQFYVDEWINYTHMPDVAIQPPVQPPISPPVGSAPSVTTQNASNITSNSANVGINVTSAGSSPVIRRGIIFSNSPTMPSVHQTNNVVTAPGTTGTATINLPRLASNTLYYVWAFAENAFGISYGQMVSFTTQGLNIHPPAVRTDSVTRLSNTSMDVRFNVESDNGSTITERGVVFSIANSNPSLNQTGTRHQSVSGGLGAASINISALTVGAPYYVRAYARNAAGVSYGRVIRLGAEDSYYIQTSSVQAVTNTSAIAGGTFAHEITGRVLERGVVYSSTSRVPTISHNVLRAAAQNTPGFQITLTGLTPNTDYFVRAFVRTNDGYYYGEVVQFRTNQTPPNRNISILFRTSNGQQVGSQQFTLSVGSSITEGMLQIPAGFELESATFRHVVGNEISAIAVVRPITTVTQPSTTLRFVVGSYTYSINGVNVNTDVAPFIDTAYNRTMMPLRLVSEALGAAINWDEATRTVTINQGLTQLTLTVDIPLPGGMGVPVIVNDRTYVPMRYVAEILGADVEWDGTARAIYIFR